VKISGEGQRKRRREFKVCPPIGLANDSILGHQTFHAEVYRKDTIRVRAAKWIPFLQLGTYSRVIQKIKHLGGYVAENNKRRRILEAASEIFSEKGIQKTTITEIAHKAGVVDSIIYYYFKNKEDLLFCCLDAHMTSSIEEINCQFQGIIGATAKLGKMIWYHLHANDCKQGNERILKMLLLECRANKNFYMHEGYNSLKKYASIMTKILKEGIDEGVFRRDLNIGVVRDIIFGLLDEESISCLATREVTKTLPDFEPIMCMVLSMIERKPNSISSYLKNDKAENVLNAAINIFSRKGFSGTTMSEIAKESNVAEGTIYEYYTNKEDLLFSTAKVWFEQFDTEMNKMFTLDDPLVKLRHFIISHFFIFFKKYDFLTLFLQDIKLNKHFYQSNSYAFFLHSYNKMLFIFEEGKHTGLFHKNINNRVFRNLFIGSFTHLLLRWLFISKLTPLRFIEEFTILTELMCDAVTIKKSSSN
jgi:TetR/AcrR family fatty acid metabolism transcriptional regulator